MYAPVQFASCHPVAMSLNHTSERLTVLVYVRKCLHLCMYGETVVCVLIHVKL